MGRISPLSIIAGVMLTLASMFLCMSLAAAFGFWNFQPAEIPMARPNFWVVASISWTFSVSFGTFLTVVASRTKEMKSGMVNALTTWAGAYLLFGGIALTIADTTLRSFLGYPPVGIFWHGFIGDAAALLAGILGGAVGVYFERGAFKIHKVNKEKRSFSRNAIPSNVPPVNA